MICFSKYFWLVVSNIFYFPFHVILPIDELVFFKMVIAPPTRFHLWLYFWRAIEPTYDQPIPIIVNPQVHRVMLYFDEMAEVCLNG